MLKFKGNHLQREARLKEGKKEKGKTEGIFPTSRNGVKKIKKKINVKADKKEGTKKRKTWGGGSMK